MNTINRLFRREKYSGQITRYSDVCPAAGSQRRLSGGPKAIGPA
ncbi:MAG: hypothetical protein ACLQVL_17735 [Terriglobia bacterium]